MDSFIISTRRDGDISIPIFPSMEPKIGDKIYVTSTDIKDDTGKVYRVVAVEGDKVTLRPDGWWGDTPRNLRGTRFTALDMAIATEDDFQERAERDI